MFRLKYFFIWLRIIFQIWSTFLILWILPEVLLFFPSGYFYLYVLEYKPNLIALPVSSFVAYHCSVQYHCRLPTTPTTPTTHTHTHTHTHTFLLLLLSFVSVPSNTFFIKISPRTTIVSFLESIITTKYFNSFFQVTHYRYNSQVWIAKLTSEKDSI